MCHVLSENGMEDIAWKLLLNEDYPGWLHEIKLGATTVWERWNSVEDDGSISSTGMNSLNHYSYGSVVEWLFRYAAGIQLPNTPGFQSVRIAPSLNWSLGEMEASYDSPAGIYKTAWKLTDPTHVELSVEVPFGCSAQLVLPKAKEETFTDSQNPMFADVKDGVCYLEPGSYAVSYETTESLKMVYSSNTPIRELLANPQVKEAIATVMPLDMIPTQFISYSMRELGEQFGQGMNEEQLKGIDLLLSQF